MFDYLMKSRFERTLILAFAIALSLSAGGMIASSVSKAFGTINQALAPIEQPAKH